MYSDAIRKKYGPALRGVIFILSQSATVFSSACAITYEHSDGAPFAVFALFDRIEHPARGRDGGAAGRPGRAYLSNGKALKGKGKQIVPAGLSLVMELPGGGGLGTDGDNL